MSIDHATSLKALQLYGMATAWSELQAEKPKQAHRPESWMERLLAAEQTDRQLKSLRYQLKAARFPIHVICWALTGLKHHYRKRSLNNWRVLPLWKQRIT